MRIEFFSSGTTRQPTRVTVDYQGIIDTGRDAFNIIGGEGGVVLNTFPAAFIAWYCLFEYCKLANAELINEFRDDVTMVAGMGDKVKEVLKKPNKIEHVIVIKGTVDEEIEELCKDKKLYETYGASEWGRAWLTCLDREQGFHIGEGLKMTQDGLVYNNVCTGDRATLISGQPCPACGFEGQRLKGPIERGPVVNICK